jgi:hypothetical protein
LKAYVYTDEELSGAFQVPFDHYELPGTLERTENPKEADCLFISAKMEHVEMRNPQRIHGVLPALSRLRYWEKYEGRHFFFMHGDEDRPIRTTAIVFRWSVNKNDKDPKTVTMPAPIHEDLSQHMLYLAYEDGLMYDTCFVGFDIDPHGIRKKCIKAIKSNDRLVSYLSPIGIHYGGYERTEKGEIRRGLFIDALRQAKLPIAPRGAGQHSYRFIEALSARRVPILVADDWQLPFEKKLIDYDNCIFRVSESKAATIDQEILRILEENPTDKLAQMAEAGYWYWDRWLRPERWPEAVLRYLEQML